MVYSRVDSKREITSAPGEYLLRYKNQSGVLTKCRGIDFSSMMYGKKWTGLLFYTGFLRFYHREQGVHPIFCFSLKKLNLLPYTSIEVPVHRHSIKNMATLNLASQRLSGEKNEGFRTGIY